MNRIPKQCPCSILCKERYTAQIGFISPQALNSRFIWWIKPNDVAKNYFVFVVNLVVLLDAHIINVRQIFIQNAHNYVCLFCQIEHVYSRPEVNSNRFEISLWGKISLRCEVTSLSAFTWLRTKWNSPRYKFQTAVSFPRK